MMHMTAEFAYIMLVSTRKQPMRFISQSHDKLIYIWVYLSIGVGLLLILLECTYLYIEIINKVGFIIHEDLCLIDKGNHID